jgi:hypothetical protein
LRRHDPADASSIDVNGWTFKHSSRKRPLNDSINAGRDAACLGELGVRAAGGFWPGQNSITPLDLGAVSST